MHREEEEETSADEATLEWIKFAVFVAILVGTVLVIWVAAPAIFDRVVPAVLGRPGGEPSTIFMPTTGSDSAPDAVIIDENEVLSPVGDEPPADEAAPGEPAVVEQLAPDEPPQAAADPQSVGGYPAADDEAVPPLALARPQVHIIEAGETLSAISERYGVTVADLLLVNQLTNANLIQVGQELLIPVSLDE